ncbi:hypothetical protein [Candidatus Liberibacter sp.]|uniref:hypothetical protein n=1 Tax=Candidatus Liberibacter sp. TaxID=34022 RepID=UPI0015F6A469|nr:hypothetical protein [Candidatus Liberibacter sp.]MBA5724367.1 hypothetical protein [Candidatus Liberibacter sp.]
MPEEKPISPLIVDMAVRLISNRPADDLIYELSHQPLDTLKKLQKDLMNTYADQKFQDAYGAHMKDKQKNTTAMEALNYSTAVNAALENVKIAIKNQELSK